ncbi:MAG: YraN family protein [Kiloniellales bacterium]|nr:YraN family protein [Kiloniellales bacterium]
MTALRRRRAWLRGRHGEGLAASWLRLKGYRLLARNFRHGAGEIDLIARRGRILALVEVKTRGDLASASEALGPRQRARIVRATQAFLQQRPQLAQLSLRFDVILVAPGRLPRHLRDAWRPESER